VLPQSRPDGGYDTLFLDSGQNPPNGVVVHYHLPDPPPREVTLTFLDAKGRELRSFDGVPAKAGINRFLWNRRLPGAPIVLAKDLEPLLRNDGPQIVPGRYAVRLTASGQAHTQSFDLLPDPRISSNASDLASQFAFLKAILAKLATVNTTINGVDAVLAQAANVAQRARSAAVRKAVDALQGELRALRAALIDVNYSQAQLYGSRLHEKLNALFDTVDSGDFAPAQQARELFAVLSEELEVVLRRWHNARERLLPALNRAAAKAGLQVIG
jgi:hypothetical protein